MRFDRKGPIYIPVTESAGGGLGSKEKKDTRSKKKSTQKQKSRLRYLKAQKEQEREKKMKKYIVLIKDVDGDMTVGELKSSDIESLMGEEVEVELQDENGNFIEVFGVLIEVLEEV